MNLAFKAMRCDSLWFADPSPAARQKRLIRITARVSSINTISFPTWEAIDFAFPARGDMPPFTIHWWNGGDMPDIRRNIEALWADIPGAGTTDRSTVGDGTPNWVGVTGKWSGASGTWIPGTAAQIHANAHNMSYSLHPLEKYKGFKGGPPRTLPRTSGPEMEWLNAIRGGRAPHVQLRLFGAVCGTAPARQHRDAVRGASRVRPGGVQVHQQREGGRLAQAAAEEGMGNVGAAGAAGRDPEPRRQATRPRMHSVDPPNRLCAPAPTPSSTAPGGR